MANKNQQRVAAAFVKWMEANCGDILREVEAKEQAALENRKRLAQMEVRLGLPVSYPEALRD